MILQLPRWVWQMAAAGYVLCVLGLLAAGVAKGGFCL